MTSTFATKQDLKILEKRIDKRFEQIDKRFEQVDKRFEELDKKIEDRFDRMMELSHLNAMESMRFIGGKFDKMERAHNMLRIKVADNSAEISKLKRASR